MHMINRLNMRIIVLVVVIVLCGTSFVAGMQVQKSRSNPNERSVQRKSTKQNSQPVSESPFGNMMIGTVAKISGSNITITQPAHGQEKSYMINNDTKVIKDGTAATIDSIKEGERVMIEPSGSDKVMAKRIIAGLPSNPVPQQ